MRVLKCRFEMRFYIQYIFVCESFAFENVRVISHHGLKAMLQSPFGHFPLWRLLVARSPSSVTSVSILRDLFSCRYIKESGRDQCSVSLRQMACYSSLCTQMADRKFCILIDWFVTREKWACSIRSYCTQFDAVFLLVAKMFSLQHVVFFSGQILFLME